MRERDSSLRKLKSISKKEDTISDCACLSANRLAFDTGVGRQGRR
jgi:hypothetical protein